MRNKPVGSLAEQIRGLMDERDALAAIVTKTKELLELVYPIERIDGSSGDPGAVLVAGLWGMIEAREAGKETSDD